MAGSLGAMKKLDGADQHLFGYSTAQQAGAGETFFLDDGDFGAKLVRRFRRIHAGGAAADDDQVVVHWFHLEKKAVSSWQ